MRVLKMYIIRTFFEITFNFDYFTFRSLKRDFHIHLTIPFFMNIHISPYIE